MYVCACERMCVCVHGLCTYVSICPYICVGNVPITHYIHSLLYHIAEKFGGNNFWQKWMDGDFGKKSLTNEWMSQKFIIIVATNLVW